MKISRKLDEKNGKELFSEVEFFSNEKLDFYSRLPVSGYLDYQKRVGLRKKYQGKLF